MANNKKLPDWSTAPEWANWRAADADGVVWYYGKKPSLGPLVWFWEDCRIDRIGEFEIEDWQNSLEQRPENTPPTPEELDRICGPEYELWQYLHDELGVIALETQLGDIMDIVRRIEKQKEQQ